MSIGWVNDLAAPNAWVAVLNAVSFGLVALAVVRGWRSAESVVPRNRPWTRAWRIVVVLCFGLTINGLMLPFGAVYALAVYKVPRKSAASNA